MAEQSHEDHCSAGGGYGRWVFWGFLLVAGYFLITEHRAHVFQFLPIAAWRVLYAAQREGRLAASGPYARVRHPQYLGFIAIMFGFLLQWPTLVTLVMFPILVFMYARLARRAEADMLAQFGDEYRRYRDAVPALIPKFHRERRYV